MNKSRIVFFVCTLLFCMAYALAEPALRIRGVVTRLEGDQLQVQTRDDQNLSLNAADAKISELSALKLSDIKPGSFVGVTAVPQGKTLRALEVHLFPEAMRGTGEGHYPWDLKPNSTMTNANVDAVVQEKKGRELELSYQGGKQQIFVPRGVPIVTFKPGDRSLLKAGAQVFIIADRAADGSLVARRIQVGSKGVRPPM